MSDLTDAPAGTWWHIAYDDRPGLFCCDPTEAVRLAEATGASFVQERGGAREVIWEAPNDVDEIAVRAAIALGARDPDHALDIEGSWTTQRILDLLDDAGLRVVDQRELARFADEVDVAVVSAMDRLRSIALRGEEP